MLIIKRKKKRYSIGMIPKEIYVGFLHAINALLNLLRIQAKNFEILINVIL